LRAGAAVETQPHFLIFNFAFLIFTSPVAQSPDSSKTDAAPAGYWPASSFRIPHSALRILPLLLFLFTATLFSPSLRDDFVAWDDNHTFYENPHIQGLDAARLRWMLTDVRYSMRYKPLSWLEYALIFEAGGMKPFAYHLIGLLFHSANAVLVYFLLRRLLQLGFTNNSTGPPIGLVSLFAALAALLWAVHPLRVEPVLRATDLTYPQTLFFTLLSLLCYLRAVAPADPDAPPRKSWFAISIFLFAVAMLIYPFIIGYAVVLLALDYFPLRRFPQVPLRRLLLEKIPFALLACLILLTFYGRLNPGQAFADRKLDLHFSLLSRLMQAFYIWAYYLWKPWLPLHLSPVYTTLVDFNPLSLPFIASALLVLGLTVLLLLRRRAWPLAFTLWLCHLALLVPALGLTEHPHYASDRYSYVAGLLWPILLAALGLKLFLNHKKLLAPAALSLCALCALCIGLTLRQLPVWRDTPTLFNYLISQLGHDPYREDIHLRLGAWYADRQDFPDATAQFQAALAVNPSSADAENLLGGMSVHQGRNDDAARHFAAAVQISPGYLDARRNYASTLSALGRTADAITQYQQAVALDPSDPDTREALGVLLCNQRRYDDAVVQLQAALALQPNYAEAHNALGVALFNQGHLDDAITHFQFALKLKPAYADARTNLRAALAQKPRH
jgi:protein O-mannosyl-transferase